MSTTVSLQLVRLHQRFSVSSSAPVHATRMRLCFLFGLAIVPLAQALARRAPCNCPGPPAHHVCGADGQTYGNACIMACANVPLDHYGACDKACYPPTASSKPRSWLTSCRRGACPVFCVPALCAHQPLLVARRCPADYNGAVHIAPVCTVGLTYYSVAEAQGDGYTVPQCIKPGVCRYRADGKPNFLPTTGGKHIGALPRRVRAVNSAANHSMHDSALLLLCILGEPTSSLNPKNLDEPT